MANDNILKMLSLSEEINMLNFKIAQIIKDLEFVPDSKSNLDTLASRLSDKISDLENQIKSFVPTDRLEEKLNIEPSYVTENQKKEMVDLNVPPTPESVGNVDTIKETEPEEIVEDIDPPIKENKPLKKKAIKPPNRRGQGPFGNRRMNTKKKINDE